LGGKKGDNRDVNKREQRKDKEKNKSREEKMGFVGY